MVITRICPATDIVCNNPLCGPTVCAIASARFFTPPPISGDVETMTPEQAVEHLTSLRKRFADDGDPLYPKALRQAVQANYDALTLAIAALSLPAVPVDMNLPETLEGHWATSAGREMAMSYVSKDRDRSRLCMGHLTDFELANAIFMVSGHEFELIALQTAAKERIRWLSAQLALALRQPPPEASLGGEWRDLASAPKDGTDFLALIPWQRKHHQMAGCFAPDGKFRSWPGRNRYEPTHWRPLPAPPALNGGGK